MRVWWSVYLQVLQVVRAQLGDDAWQQVLQLLGLRHTRHHVRVGCDGRLHPVHAQPRAAAVRDGGGELEWCEGGEEGEGAG